MTISWTANFYCNMYYKNLKDLIMIYEYIITYAFLKLGTKNYT